jgi:hypothetical protein
LRAHLRPLENRSLHPALQKQPRVNLEWVCFYKNLADLFQDKDLDDEQITEILHMGPTIYEELGNLSVHQYQCYDRSFELIYLSPTSVRILQFLGLKFRGTRHLPFFHQIGMPSVAVIDTENHCGFGPRAILQLSMDRKKALFLHRSIEEFLQDHLQKLSSNWYSNLKGGVIEPFARVPSDALANGSVTVTRGVKVSCHALYSHIQSFFDSEDGEDRLFFAYQIKIEPVPDPAFKPCKLRFRTWKIECGAHTQTVDR